MSVPACISSRGRPSLLLLLLAVLTPAHAQDVEPRSRADVDRLAAQVTSVADAYVAAFVTNFPERAELSGLSTGRHDTLMDNSLAALRRWERLEDGWAQAIGLFDSAALRGRPEWVTLGFLREALESSRILRVCRHELWPVNQLSGWQATLAQLVETQPVGGEKTRADALARWRQLPRYLDTEIRNLQEGVLRSYTTPKRNVQLVIDQLDVLLSKPVDQWPFYSPARRDESDAFRRAWHELLSKRIAPSIKRYRTYLRDEYLLVARERIAITAIPNGKACYQASLRAHTTLERTGTETVALGRKETDKNLIAALEIGRTSLDAHDLEKLVARINGDHANRFESREQLLEFARQTMARAHRALSSRFSRVPKAGVVVEPYPEFLERDASDSYWPASEDGVRPAQYRITLQRFAETTRSNAEITAFHETYPGHHLQIGIGLEQHTAHAITRLVGSSGFAEGWARYAEALAEEMGLYSSDYARANRRLWPGRGMVVDPSLHLLGWTRERAITFVQESGRFSAEGAAALIDRIAVWPGQLAAYDTGALEFFALREQAREVLGQRFDIRGFHDALLGSGTVTLPMLREQMHAWLKRESI
jgi:uncharacterized protein (DUF885 family)